MTAIDEGGSAGATDAPDPERSAKPTTSTALHRDVFDVVVVGGGIVGVATAHALLQRTPDLRVAVLEKEPTLAAHQTGHNSGVVHSGLYYKPGSAKARTCVAGSRAMAAFCDEHDLPRQIVGKVVVATTEDEVPRLDELERRGMANGVPDLRRIDAGELRDIEPHARGVGALHVPHASIVDYAAITNKLAELVRLAGGTVVNGCRVTGLVHRGGADGETVLRHSGPADGGGEVRARRVVACAGLWADRFCSLDGERAPARIVPFRGEYHDLVPDAWPLVNGLIYPVPDPAFPFLGVHLTRMVHGGVEAGPNAVLALRRDGYGKLSFGLRDALGTATYPGFWRLAAKHWRTGIGEIWRSFSRAAFARALAKLVPEIRPEHLQPGGAGVRAQALTPAGALVDDFLLVERGRTLHVCNAPSPAATASLAIGAEIAGRVLGEPGHADPAASGA